RGWGTAEAGTAVTSTAVMVSSRPSAAATEAGRVAAQLIRRRMTRLCTPPGTPGAIGSRSCDPPSSRPPACAGPRPGCSDEFGPSGPSLPADQRKAGTMFKDTKAFSGFSVDDTEQAKEFYGGVLGLPVSEDHGILTLHIAGDRNTIVYPKGSGHTPPTYTILNFPVSDIESAADEPIPRGGKVEHYDFVDPKALNRQGGPCIAWFKAPAGNILSVIQQD